MDINMLNILVLAYIGDAIYEVMVRDYLINKGYNKVNQLQKESLKFVSARRQAYFLKVLIDDNKLNNDELEILHRARNCKINSKSKNCDVLTYKHATALESVFGYLYYKNNKERIDELFNLIKEIE